MDNTMERLKITDFLTIKEFDWEVEHFNIITGDMGSGKSLSIKLLKFFEDIIPDLLVLPYEQFTKRLEYETFFVYLEKKFRSIFYLPDTKKNGYENFNLEYMFSHGKQTVKIVIKNDGNNKLLVESPFLQKLLDDWKKTMQNKHKKQKNGITLDGLDEVKLLLYHELLNMFGGHFPISTTFIPASRAALAFGANYTDDYLKEYNELTSVLPTFVSRKSRLIKTILKAEMKTNGVLWLESDDGRKVPIEKASSGQQEIVYVLMLLEKLGNFRYSYGRDQSLFIEEPSAHLFPLEQKQTIELILEIFNALKKKRKPVRFFITTHSPYILNSLNNILKKGSLLEKHADKADKINAAVNIPHLYAKEVSAYYISGDGIGKSMLDKAESYLYDVKIADISRTIDEDTATLIELNRDLSAGED
jgi:predicted ATPase